MHYFYTIDGLFGYILQILPVVILSGMVYILLRFRYVKCHKKYCGFQNELLYFLMVCYISALAAISLVPNNFWTSIWFFVHHGYSGCEIGPLLTLEYNTVPIIIPLLRGELELGDWPKTVLVYNTLLFLPLGLLLPCIKNRKFAFNFSKVIAIGFAASLLIELLQPLIGRVFDVDDIIMNVAGTILGYFLYKCFSMTKRLRKLG